MVSFQNNLVSGHQTQTIVDFAAIVTTCTLSLSVLSAILPSKSGLAGFIELSMTEVVVTTEAIRRAKLQSNRHHQQTNTQLFTGWNILSPNEQCYNTETCKSNLQLQQSCNPQLLFIIKIVHVVQNNEKKYTRQSKIKETCNKSKHTSISSQKINNVT